MGDLFKEGLSTCLHGCCVATAPESGAGGYGALQDLFLVPERKKRCKTLVHQSELHS